MGMRRVRVVNRTRSTTLAEQAEVAESFGTRGIGLIGRRDWTQADGLVIMPCSSVHCCFMSMSIDVAYVRRDNRIGRLVPDLRPWRFGPLSMGTRYVVELPVGVLARGECAAGDELAIEPLEGEASGGSD